MSFEAIRTERLLLRPLEMPDAEAVFAYRSLPEVSRYQFWHPRALDEVRAFIESLQAVEPDTPGTWFQIALVLRETDELVGDSGLHFLEEGSGTAEVGITVAPAHQGRGLGAEALRAVFGYLFDTLGKHRVVGSVDPRNMPSRRLLERVGLRREGHFVESLRFKDLWVDDMIYAMLDWEWAVLTTR